MKIILSRKGFDAANGGVPSPILPDGRLVPLPIPSGDQRRYGDLSIAGLDVGSLVSDLTGGRIEARTRCHLDPDLDPGTVARHPAWRPAFGQIDAAQGHLVNRGVGPGDLFLFFGWFRQAEQDAAGRWRFVPRAPDLHVIFGWLLVGDVVRLGMGEVPSPVEAFADHPHMRGRDRPSNALYLAADRLWLDGRPVRPAGIFPCLSEARLLTASGQPNRSMWRLPRWMHPADVGTCVSYHEDAVRWTSEGEETCLLRSVAKGQEFVVDADPGLLMSWAAEVLVGAG